MKTWTETDPGFDAQAVLTRRAGAEACRQVGELARPVAQVADEFGVCWWTVMGVGGHHPVGRSGIGGRRGGLLPVGRELASLRLMVVPIAAYSLLTPVLHPWYVLILVVLMVFLTPTGDESRWRWLLLVPWWDLTATLVFSYLTYRDPEAFAELEWVRRLQWLPTLASLAAVAGWSLVCRRSVGAPMSTGTGCGGSLRDGRRR